MGDERTYLSEAGVTVTNRRIAIEGKTYATKHVTSVEAVSREPRRGFLVVMGMCGLLFVAAGLVAAALGDWETFWGAGGFGGVVVLVAYLGLRGQKTTYILRMSSSSGEAEALKTTDKEHVLNTVRAIRQAITEPE